MAFSCQAKEISVEKPEIFHQLIDNYFRTVIELNPGTASHLGLDPSGNIHTINQS